jgi:hypothetical protein
VRELLHTSSSIVSSVPFSSIALSILPKFSGLSFGLPPQKRAARAGILSESRKNLSIGFAHP